MDKFILYKENINVSENIINSIGGSVLNVIVKLSDIKELIHVEGNKLTIDPLTNKGKNYYYSNSGLFGPYKNDERQLFRIDHDDIFEKYKLVDEKNNEIKITKEEYEELTKDGDK